MLHIKDHAKKERQIKVIQFGGGVFLRGFFDVMLQKLNDSGEYESGAVIVRSKTKGTDPLEAQNYNYTHIARDGEHCDVTLVDVIMDSVSANDDYEKFLSLADTDADVIVSNTTEAGIAYLPCDTIEGKCPESYPAKLTSFLYRRYKGTKKGFLILPCELIESNGDILRSIVLRHARELSLGEDFIVWVNSECSFRNTLVDRIVSGAPSADENFDLGYCDGMINTSEYFSLFCIEGGEDERLPLERIGMGVKFVQSVVPYRTIKVRILNGAHTSMIPYAMTLEVETVGDRLCHETLSRHLRDCLNEIIFSLDIDEKETRAYANEVVTRFSNPHIRHLCSAIALNSVSKFGVRVTPSIVSYREKSGENPMALTVALQKLIEFYKYGSPRDSEEVVEYMKSASVEEILRDGKLGADLRFLSESIGGEVLK